MHGTLIEELIQLKRNEIDSLLILNQLCIATSLATSPCHVTLLRRLPRYLPRRLPRHLPRHLIRSGDTGDEVRSSLPLLILVISQA